MQFAGAVLQGPHPPALGPLDSRNYRRRRTLAAILSGCSLCTLSLVLPVTTRPRTNVLLPSQRFLALPLGLCIVVLFLVSCTQALVIHDQPPFVHLSAKQALQDLPIVLSEVGYLATTHDSGDSLAGITPTSVYAVFTFRPITNGVSRARGLNVGLNSCASHGAGPCQVVELVEDVGGVGCWYLAAALNSAAADAAGLPASDSTNSQVLNVAMANSVTRSANLPAADLTQSPFVNVVWGRSRAGVTSCTAGQARLPAVPPSGWHLTFQSALSSPA